MWIFVKLIFLFILDNTSFDGDCKIVFLPGGKGPAGVSVISWTVLVNINGWSTLAIAKSTSVLFGV